MVPIRGGTFVMGASTELQSAALELCREEIGTRNRVACVRDVVESEGPQRKVYLSPFSIDRVEVTVAAWRACVQAGACSPAPLALADARFLRAEPAGHVGDVERGGRLLRAGAARACRPRPSGSARPAAPTGASGRGATCSGRARSTTGASPAATTSAATSVALIRPDASDGATFLAPVGAHPDGASPEGVLDMAGNVMEWTADYYRPESPQSMATVNPRGPDAGAMRSLRGGSWRQPPFFARTSYREATTPDTRSTEIGFRCAR